MTPKKKIVVVDGSNLATEGRTLPSLVQLDEAVRAIADEIGDADVIVVVDATFEHRIEERERPRFKEAELEGEIVTPPAGAIGRGDAFILKIASRAGAIVVSNDSFQEFHGEHPWLFEDGRLIGGKPIPGIGWVFTPRNPVRGPKSRASRSRAAASTPADSTPAAPAAAEPARSTRSRRGSRGGVAAPEPVEASATVASAAKKTATRRAAARAPETTKAPAARTAAKRTTEKRAAAPASTPRKPAKAAARVAKGVAAAPSTSQPAKSTARKAKGRPAESIRPAAAKKAAPSSQAATAASRASSRATSKPVNTSRAFQALVSRHPIGSRVEGEVNSFTSHGATVTVTVGRGTQVVCYAPLAGLAKPPPTRARDVLTKGQRVSFRIAAFDEERRIAELSLI